MHIRFQNREEAGRLLAELLRDRAAEHPIVLALPRGGVTVGAEVAKELGAPLDIWVVRKVGAPGFPELGMGAVAEGGVIHLDPEILREVGVSREDAEYLAKEKVEEVERRVKKLRGGRPPPKLQGRTVIIVDDGIATGGTMRAAISAVRAQRPAKIVLAVPIAATQSLESMRDLVEEVACVEESPAMHAIGAWYEEFEQVPDEEVIRLLQVAQRRMEAPPREGVTAGAAPRGGSLRGPGPHEVSIDTEAGPVHGTLTLPEGVIGLVIFAHGSGSSRFSPRNNQVAEELREYGLGTLLFDLLTEREDMIDAHTAEYRFDIRLLADRLVQVTNCVRAQPELVGMPLGYFGSSTGAAAALVAAAKLTREITAVVSRGGRPDLAWNALGQVEAPTLLVVGGNDRTVLELNQRAAARMINTTHELAVVPHATHLFEEPGALDMVARLAGHWFRRFFQAARPTMPAQHP